MRSTGRAGGWRGSSCGPSAESFRGPLSPRRSRRVLLPLLDQIGDPLAMLCGRAVKPAVQGEAAKKEVQVVLKGDADAAVDLHAVLDQLGAVVSDERLCRAHELLG